MARRSRISRHSAKSVVPFDDLALVVPDDTRWKKYSAETKSIDDQFERKMSTFSAYLCMFNCFFPTKKSAFSTTKLVLVPWVFPRMHPRHQRQPQPRSVAWHGCVGIFGFAKQPNFSYYVCICMHILHCIYIYYMIISCIHTLLYVDLSSCM